MIQRDEEQESNDENNAMGIQDEDETNLDDMETKPFNIKSKK